MTNDDFTQLAKEAILYNQLERYFTPKGDGFDKLNNHFDLQPDLEAIKSDKESAGGLKLSHAQRRMLMLLVALWNGREADLVFNEGFGSISKLIHSMDRNNRELVAELVVTYPGWGS